MTWPEFANFVEGFARFHGKEPEAEHTDEEFLATLAREIAAGRA